MLTKTNNKAYKQSTSAKDENTKNNHHTEPRQMDTRVQDNDGMYKYGTTSNG